jgi:hypothetical protein
MQMLTSVLRNRDFKMSESISMDTSTTVRQAYLIMFEYLDRHGESVGKNDAVSALLSESLWDTQSGGKEPMDNATFPAWLRCADHVLQAESGADRYRAADILLDGKPPTLKVLR